MGTTAATVKRLNVTRTVKQGDAASQTFGPDYFEGLALRAEEENLDRVSAAVNAARVRVVQANEDAAKALTDAERELAGRKAGEVHAVLANVLANYHVVAEGIRKSRAKRKAEQPKQARA